MQLRGHVDLISHHMVAGWACDIADPSRKVEVRVSVNGVEECRVFGRIFREGLKKLHESATGEYGFEYIFATPLSLFSEYTVTVSFVDNDALLPKGQKTLFSVGTSAKKASGPFPLLINAMGRSGTTLLMKRLSSHPEIIVAGAYPFEIKMMTYYGFAFRTLVSEGDRQRSTHPDQMAWPANRFFIGFNPYNHPSHEDVVAETGVVADFFSGTAPKVFGESFRHLTTDYYERVRISQKKVRMRYIAEKIVLNETARMAPRLFFGDAREIVLIRDPRDLVCSFESFWKFGGDDAITSIAHSLEAIKRIQQENKSDTIIVKFEDLILAHQETLAKIFKFLELDGAISILPAEEESMFRIHGTSSSPEASIGRWKTDLNPDQIKRCAVAFEPYLKFFGY